jgi:hypothetical protein
LSSASATLSTPDSVSSRVSTVANGLYAPVCSTGPSSAPAAVSQRYWIWNVSVVSPVTVVVTSTLESATVVPCTTTCWSISNEAPSPGALVESNHRVRIPVVPSADWFQ